MSKCNPRAVIITRNLIVVVVGCYWPLIALDPHADRQRQFITHPPKLDQIEGKPRSRSFVHKASPSQVYYMCKFISPLSLASRRGLLSATHNNQPPSSLRSSITDRDDPTYCGGVHLHLLLLRGTQEFVINYTREIAGLNNSTFTEISIRKMGHWSAKNFNGRNFSY